MNNSSAQNSDLFEYSYSSQNTFHSCPRKLEFHKIYKAKRRNDSIPANAGKAVHAGFQEYLISRDENKALFAAYLAYGAFENPYYKINHDRSFSACIGTLLHLFENFPFEDYTLATINNRPAVEVGIRLILSESFHYIGFIDCIFYDEIQDRYIIVDIKTHRNHIADKLPLYQFDSQCIPYAYALAHMQEDFFTFDCMYISVFLDTIKPSMEIYEITRTIEDAEDWFTTLKLDMKEIQFFRESNYFPRHGNACMSFNSPCPHFDYCHVRNPEKLIQLVEKETEPRSLPEADITIDMSEGV